MNMASSLSKQKDSSQLEFFGKLQSVIEQYEDIDTEFVAFDQLQSRSSPLLCEVDDQRASSIPTFLNREALEAAAKACRMSSHRIRNINVISRANFVFRTLSRYLRSVDSSIQLR